MQSAPGRHYREGISLIDLFKIFPDEKAAEAWFEHERWGTTGQFCPRCGGCDRIKPIESRKPMPYCAAIGRSVLASVQGRSWSVAKSLYISGLSPST